MASISPEVGIDIDQKVTDKDAKMKIVRLDGQNQIS